MEGLLENLSDTNSLPLFILSLNQKDVEQIPLALLSLFGDVVRPLWTLVTRKALRFRDGDELLLDARFGCPFSFQNHRATPIAHLIRNMISRQTTFRAHTKKLAVMKLPLRWAVMFDVQPGVPCTELQNWKQREFGRLRFRFEGSLHDAVRIISQCDTEFFLVILEEHVEEVRSVNRRRGLDEASGSYWSSAEQRAFPSDLPALITGSSVSLPVQPTQKLKLSLRTTSEKAENEVVSSNGLHIHT